MCLVLICLIGSKLEGLVAPQIVAGAVVIFTFFVEESSSRQPLQDNLKGPHEEVCSFSASIQPTTVQLRHDRASLQAIVPWQAKHFACLTSSATPPKEPKSTYSDELSKQNARGSGN